MDDKRMIHAVLVDPHTHTVTDIEIDGNSFNDFYKHMDCDMVEVIHWRRPAENIPGVPVLYVDEEGLLKRNKAYFALPNMLQRITGKAIFVSHNPTKRHPAGDCKFKAVDLLPHVQWLSPLSVVK